MSYTVAQILQIGNVCQYLAADDEVKKNFTSNGFIRPGLSRLIYIVKSAVNWLNTNNPSSSLLTGQANYLFSLCQPYVAKALQIIANNMGGTIVNPATGVISTLQPIYLQFRVGVTSSPQTVNGVNVTLPTNGQNSIVLPLTYILASLVIIKDDQVLPVNDPFQISYTPIYTNNNATITLANGSTFNNGDLYVIQGYQFVAV